VFWTGLGSVGVCMSSSIPDQRLDLLVTSIQEKNFFEGLLEGHRQIEKDPDPHPYLHLDLLVKDTNGN
jgi:hypothetical protein